MDGMILNQMFRALSRFEIKLSPVEELEFVHLFSILIDEVMIESAIFFRHTYSQHEPPNAKFEAGQIEKSSIKPVKQLCNHSPWKTF